MSLHLWKELSSILHLDKDFVGMKVVHKLESPFSEKCVGIALRSLVMVLLAATAFCICEGFVGT